MLHERREVRGLASSDPWYKVYNDPTPVTKQPTHILTVRTQNWTRAEYIEPGRIAPRDEQTELYRGSVEDCDTIAEAKGILTMLDEIPATEETPFHSRVDLEPKTTDTGLTELWCLARPIEKVTPWVEGLPLAGDVFTAASCPHDRIGECWACQDETNPHAEFAQMMFDAGEELTKARKP